MIKFSEYKKRHDASITTKGELHEVAILFKTTKIKLSYAKYLSIFKRSRNSVIVLALDRLIDDIENDRFDITIGNK